MFKGSHNGIKFLLISTPLLPIKSFTEKFNWFSFWHQYNSNTSSSITFNYKDFLKISSTRTGAWLSLLSLSCWTHFSCNSPQWNLPLLTHPIIGATIRLKYLINLIESCKAMETAHFMDVSWSFQIFYGLHFFGIIWHSLDKSISLRAITTFLNCSYCSSLNL